MEVFTPLYPFLRIGDLHPCKGPGGPEKEVYSCSFQGYSMNLHWYGSEHRVLIWGLFSKCSPRGFLAILEFIEFFKGVVFNMSSRGSRGFRGSRVLALFRSLCNRRQLSRKNKFDKLSGMFPALVFVAF